MGINLLTLILFFVNLQELIYAQDQKTCSYSHLFTKCDDNKTMNSNLRIINI